MPVSIVGEQKLYPTVGSIDEVSTEEWLEAAHGSTEIIGCMGGQFSMTKDDMLGNIKKVRTKFETDKEKFRLMKDLLQDEKDKKEDKNDKSGTVGGLWLKRGMEYLCEVFYALIKEHEASKQPGGTSDSGAVKAACKTAYEKTLTKYHNMATRMIVKGAVMVSPYKETLMTNLARGVKDKTDEIIAELIPYEKALRAFVIIVCQLFQTFGFKDECIESHA